MATRLSKLAKGSGSNVLGTAEAEPVTRRSAAALRAAQIQIPPGWERDGWEIVEHDGVDYLELSQEMLLKLDHGDS
jgi:hypothetical protein